MAENYKAPMGQDEDTVVRGIALPLSMIDDIQSLSTEIVAGQGSFATQVRYVLSVGIATLKEKRRQ